MGVYLPFTSRLPSTYQEVEYIQSSGTQYIDTGISIGTSTNSEILEGKIQFNSNSSSQVNGKNKKSALFFGTNTSNKFYASSGSAGTWGATSLTNDYQPHIFRIAQSETNLYIDGTAYSFSGGTLQDSTTTNIYIGACSDAGNTAYYCKENIYRFKIRQGGTLVRDFIPCYRKSDNVIGLYDLVNNQFYTNSGTGTFSKGADVTAVPLKNAYIGGYYEYSYDFRNKSSTILTNDGWVLVSGSPTFNANGINGQCLYKNPSLGVGKLANAQKITITLVGTPYQSNGIGCRIGVETTTSGTTGRTGNYMQANKEETSIYGTNYGDTSKSWSGKQTLITVVDLEAKTWVTTISAGYTWNGTLSSTEVSNIRNNSKVIAYNSGASCVGESINIVVEY